MTCGTCKHFRRDERKAYQRKTFSWGWCGYPIPKLPYWTDVYGDVCDPEGADRVTSNWGGNVCNTHEAK